MGVDVTTYDTLGRRIHHGPQWLHMFPAEEDDTWRLDAACRDSDPDLFFLERGASSAAAKAICAGCSVRIDCLDYAVATNPAGGIWGGMSYRERHTWLRKQRRQLKGA